VRRSLRPVCRACKRPALQLAPSPWGDRNAQPEGGPYLEPAPTGHGTSQACVVAGSSPVTLHVRRQENMDHLEHVAFRAVGENHRPVGLRIVIVQPMSKFLRQFILRPLCPPPNMTVEVISIRSFLTHSETSLSAFCLRLQALASWYATLLTAAPQWRQTPRPPMTLPGNAGRTKSRSVSPLRSERSRLALGAVQWSPS